MVRLNPDQKTVDAIRLRLQFTEGFCPCVADQIGNEDYRCPCKKFRETQECCCELYVPVEETSG